MVTEREYDSSDTSNLRNVYKYVCSHVLPDTVPALLKEPPDLPLTRCSPVSLILPNTFISKSWNLLLYISLSDTYSWLIPRVTTSLSKKHINNLASEYLENLL